jgi:hypothetical protein
MDGFKLTGSDIAALIIFIVSIVTRALMQAFVPNAMDLGWITTFAVIGAAWLSLGTRSRDIHTAAMQAKDEAVEVAAHVDDQLDSKLAVQTETIVSELKTNGLPEA